MVTIRTSRDKTYEAEYAWAPTFDGKCSILLADARRLPAIAEEFDGLQSIRMTDEAAQREYDWTGYTALAGIARTDRGVAIELAREADHGAL